MIRLKSLRGRVSKLIPHTVGLFVLVQILPGAVAYAEVVTHSTSSMELPLDFRPVDRGILFEGCSGKSHALANGRPLTPTGEELSNRLRLELLKKLFELVKERTKENRDFAADLRDCFSSGVLKELDPFGRSYCSDFREWVDPQRFSLVEGPLPTADYTPLQRNIDITRFNLAMVPRDDSPEALLGLNTKLDSGGPKEVPWEPLKKVERSVYEKRLHQDLEDVFNELKQQNKLGSVTDLVSLKYHILKGTRPSTNRSQRSAVRHWQRDKQLFLKSVKDARQRYLRDYREMIEDLPVLNFISSRQPSEKDISKAASQIYPNAQKEFADLSRFEEGFSRLERVLEKRPKTRIGFQDVEPLLEYRGILEEVVAANPHLCGVANYSIQRKQKVIRDRSALVTGHLLAASILLPPLGKILAVTTMGVAPMVDSYLNYRDAHPASLAAITNYDRSLRKTQSDAEAAKARLERDLKLATATFVGGGGALAGWRRLRSLKKGLSRPPTK